MAQKNQKTRKNAAAPHPMEGRKAPAFAVDSDSGSTVRLADFAGKYVVLYFYPRDMTPGCTQESCEFGESHAALKKLGAVVLGVSRDSIESHRKFRDKYGLPFELLSDADGKLCENYGVWKEKSLYGRKFMGIERSTFVIGPDGRVLKAYQPVKVTGHVAAVTQYLKELKSPAKA
jgi:peroxiredoxin Q/BCP